jgi:transcriptional regulator with XRE-family HTH domain
MNGGNEFSMKVDADLILKLRQERAWSQDELALASGLNLRTIQRIEKEATASLQSIKALASAFELNIRDLELEESKMIGELLNKEVVIVMGISQKAGYGLVDNVKGKIVEIDAAWLKVIDQKKTHYVRIEQIKRIIPQ